MQNLLKPAVPKLNITGTDYPNNVGQLGARLPARPTEAAAPQDNAILTVKALDAAQHQVQIKRHFFIG
jgi:hypothetical protein